MDLISDIHLEFDPTYRLSSIGEVLIIAGDLGKVVSRSYYDFLRHASDRYDHIILVAGNHEYYGTTIENGEKILKNLNIPNVHYLQCDSIMINGIEYLGCTLWSEILLDAGWMTNDGNSIKNFSLKNYYELYVEHSTWLTKKLNEPVNHKRVVITHHLPTFKAINDKYKGLNNTFFASALDHLVSKATVWVAGHTHSENTVRINNTYLFVNPKGYPGENSEEYSPVSI